MVSKTALWCTPACHGPQRVNGKMSISGREDGSRLEGKGQRVLYQSLETCPALSTGSGAVGKSWTHSELAPIGKTVTVA